MSDPNPKTPATRAVEGFLGSAFDALLNRAAEQNPIPPLSEPGEGISPTSIAKQIDKAVASDDHTSVVRLSLILASWVAQGAGMSFADTAQLAGLTWKQTSCLPPAPKCR